MRARFKIPFTMVGIAVGGGLAAMTLVPVSDAYAQAGRTYVMKLSLTESESRSRRMVRFR